MMPPFITLVPAVFLVPPLLIGAPGVAPDESLVFSGVNVVPMGEERVLKDRTVVIEAGRIDRIQPADQAEVPADARVIEGDGRYLMPGLAEMHAHIPGGDADADYREDVLFLYLANGVTLARGMLGHPVHLETRGELARGEILGPRLVTAGPGFSGGAVSSPAGGVRLVREQAEAGYDFLKIFGGFSLEAFDAIAGAAHDAGIPFAGHVPGNVGVRRALAAGYATIDHLDGYMPTLVDPEKTKTTEGGFFGYRFAPEAEQERIREMAERTRDAGVWNVPTESIMRSAFTVDLDQVRDTRPEFRYMPSDVVEGWFDWVSDFRAGQDYDPDAGERFIEVRAALIRALHEAGAPLLLGSDAPQWFNVPGFSAHREMQLIAEAGLSPYEVLKTATVNPAIYLNEEKVFGRIAEGYRADLVLVDDNPLDRLANAQAIAGVARHGRWLPRETIDQRLTEIADRYER